MNGVFGFDVSHVMKKEARNVMRLLLLERKKEKNERLIPLRYSPENRTTSGGSRLPRRRRRKKGDEVKL